MGDDHPLGAAVGDGDLGGELFGIEFADDGGGLARGGTVTLYVDGELVGTGRVERTIPVGYSADEGMEVGRDLGSPASPDYGPRSNEFDGHVAWVQLDMSDDDHSHLISPEDRINMAIGKQ